MSTPILPFAVWNPGVTQNATPANDNSLRNQILNGLVISESTNAQPGSPTDGDIYIITGAATGAAWSLLDQYDLAIYSSGTWYAFAPVTGIVVNIAGVLKRWNGSAYVTAGSGAAAASAAVQFTADTSSTADSDPGAGLMRWNNATQASATVLYFDDLTADAVDLTTLFGTLVAGGFLFLQDAADQDTWQIWEITSVTDAAGYTRVGVGLLANGGSFAGASSLLVTIDQGAASAGVAWGSITGTLSSQTDLQTALNAKAATASPTFTGTHTVSEADVVTGVISPAQITANTNDYAPTGFATATNVRINTDACRAITGLAGGASGRRVFLHNVGSHDILLAAEDASSTAGNRFAVNRSIVLQPKTSAALWYDATSSRWRLLDHAAPKVTNVLAADVTTTGAADTIQDVTGLSFAVLSGRTYNFYFSGAFSSTAGGNGSRWSINGPAASLISYRGQFSASATGTPTTSFNNNAYDLPAAANTTSASTGANQFYIEGTVVPTADGIVQLRFASEGAAPTNTITAIGKACFVEYEAS